MKQAVRDLNDLYGKEVDSGEGSPYDFDDDDVFSDDDDQ